MQSKVKNIPKSQFLSRRLKQLTDLASTISLRKKFQGAHNNAISKIELPCINSSILDSKRQPLGCLDARQSPNFSGGPRMMPWSIL